MINITITKKTESVINLSIKGHAGYAEYGKDIVCAGVSGTLGGLNNLQNPESFEITIDNGFAEIRVKDNTIITEHDKIVLETIITQLETIAESYPEYATVKTERN